MKVQKVAIKNQRAGATFFILRVARLKLIAAFLITKWKVNIRTDVFNGGTFILSRYSLRSTLYWKEMGFFYVIL